MQWEDRMMFYKETDFHESSIGKIPKEWEAKATDDLFIIETGTTPSTTQETYWKGGTVNWLTPTDLSKLNGKLRIRGSERKVTEKALKETSLKLMPKGSIILSTRAPVGYVATLEEEATFNQGCKGLIPRRTNELFSEFYTYYLSNKQKVLQNLSCGSTFLELSKNRLEQFSMPYLPVPEQRAVVGVLGVVDSALELANQVIAKTERLKKGLMQQLLTHGIGHTEYKETPIGKIPLNWEITTIGSILTLQRGHDLPLSKRQSGAIPVIGSNGVAGYHSKCMATGPGVTIGRSGSIGKAFYVEEDYWPLNTSLYVKEFKSVYPKYAYYLFEKLDLTNRMRSGTAVPTLNRNNVHPITVAIPSTIGEQQRIAEILSLADEKLKLEEIEKKKIERVKQGLMDLLLTGKVRIRVD